MSNESPAEQSTSAITKLAVAVVSAYVGNNSVAAADIPKLIGQVHGALAQLDAPPELEPSVELTPAVSIRKSITPEYLICLDDGKKFKSLKRHLRQLGMSPNEYRAKWGLPATYPMVAPSYSAKRSGLAKASGLGKRQSGEAEAAAEQGALQPETKPAKATARRRVKLTTQAGSA